jgi:AcrR family transcriptional regulator
MSQVSTFEVPELPVTERGRATRQAILDAAEATIAEFGYERASVAEITRRAGIAQGTFYVHFPDKKAAFLELVRHVNHQVRETGAKAIDGLSDRSDMERKGFGAFFDRVLAEPAVYQIIRQAEFVDTEIQRSHYKSLASPYAEGLRRAMEEGQVADDIDPELLAYILMGIAEFMGMKMVLWEQKIPEPEAFDQLMTFVLRGMGARGSKEDT